MEREWEYLRAETRMWDDQWWEKWFWEAGEGRNSKSVEWKQVAREKTRFEMKIMRGKKKVKCGKRREG